MLKVISERAFDKVYNILEDSFPVDERRPYDLQKKLLSREEYKILGICDKEEIKAFITIYEYSDIIFVEHFAVNNKYRNQGLGSEVLKELMKNEERIICLEVELPVSDITRRRIAFYERNGFYYNDYSYKQPPLAFGQDEVELRIMTSKRRLSYEEYENVRDILYTQVYKV